jgi:hypothetical protein
MKWSGTLIAIVVALLSCPPGGKATDVPSSGRAQITLTARAPDGELPLPSARVRPTALRLFVTGVENPSMQGVAIAVHLRCNGLEGRGDHPVGAVALYPSDHPGKFTISLPAKVTELVARCKGPARLLVHLQSPVAKKPLIEPLKVTLGEPRWR